MKWVSGAKPRDRGSHGGGAQPHGLFFAAGMEQPVGENMTALGIGAKLDFIDGKECDADINWHRFDGADEESWRFRDDALFAR